MKLCLQVQKINHVSEFNDNISQKSLWFESKGECVIKERSLHSLTKEFCLIRSKYSLISAGTERLVLNGGVPDSLKEKMKVPYMSGDFNFPLTYGYSLVGEIIKGENTGRIAHVMHPHADYAQVQTKDVFILPEDMDVTRAALISNAETVINAVWDGKLSLGDELLVMGYGIIGQMLSALLKHLSYDVYVVDPQCTKEITDVGFNAKIENKTFDKVFNCTASEDALQNGIDALLPEGVLIELSWYGNKEVTLNLGGSFHHDRKKIISSQVSNIPYDKHVNWNYKKRKELAVSLIQKGVFGHIQLNELSFEDAPAFYMNDKNSNKLNIITY
jgi:threonine dehydrogenase-like Zn-dependent dehydrogenase